MNPLFKDRAEAGQRLAQELEAYAGDDALVVLGLPRGGVIVAQQVAAQLGAPLDVFVVRKLGVPGHEELAMGAIATDGVRILNDGVVRSLAITESEIEDSAARETRELERREREYRVGRGPLVVAGQKIILVDDGLATGATVRAAIAALRRLGAAFVVVAIPVGPEDTCRDVSRLADDLVCLVTPEPFLGVGRWYEDFRQADDDDVRAALVHAARSRRPPAPAGARRPPHDAAVEIRKVALPLAAGGAQAAGIAPIDHLLAAVGDAHFVLIGEASHGTREFQTTRAEITRRLIESKGFQAVAVEADWPDAYRVNRFVRGQSDDAGAIEALAGFKRFPAWMWRNTDVGDFVSWLKDHNDRLPAAAPKVGFYGLDLYSLYASIDAIIATLDGVDPEAGRRARRRYAGLDHLRDDAERYGLPANLGVTKAGEDEAIAQLRDMRRHAGQYAASAPLPADEAFFARLNARVIANADEYYRGLFRAHELSWNLRDLHMAETLNALPLLLDGRGPRPKIVVWAHNMHVGDARQTGMGEMGELDVGQLVRQTHGADAALVGFTTYRGTVTAASAWGGPAERRNLRAAPAQSYEALFHEVGLPAFMLDLRAPNAAVDELRHRRLERAIGVVYLADSERASHTFNATMPGQFDHVIHVDESCAIEPLERTAAWIQGEMPAPPPAPA